MLKNMWIGAAGMNAQMQKIETIASNLANINTNGYKKSRVSFADLVYQQQNKQVMPVANSQPGPQFGTGVRLSSVTKVFLQGSLIQTNRELDLAIKGKGLFAVRLADGRLAYTRNGVFNVVFDDDGAGQLVNQDGLPLVLDDAEPVPEDTEKIVVSPEGRVIAVDGQGNEKEIGTIRLYLVRNLAGLKAIGRNLFQTTEASGEAEVLIPGENGTGVIKQGYLEASNVDLAEEMTSMIMAQRAYEINSRVIRTADEMWGMANNLKR